MERCLHMRHLECHCLMMKVCGFCVCVCVCENGVFQNKFQNFTKPPPLWVFDARCPDPNEKLKSLVRTLQFKSQSGSQSGSQNGGSSVHPESFVSGFHTFDESFSGVSYTSEQKRQSRTIYSKLNDGISQAGIFFRKHPRALRDPRRSPSFSSTNHRWNLFNDGNLQSFQPSTFTSFALCQKPTQNPKKNRSPIRFPMENQPSTPPGPSLWATSVEHQPKGQMQASQIKMSTKSTEMVHSTWKWLRF